MVGETSVFSGTGKKPEALKDNGYIQAFYVLLSLENERRK